MCVRVCTHTHTHTHPHTHTICIYYIYRDLEKIIQTDDARVLFGVESFDEGEEFATMATAAKNRLLRMSHPDRARQHQEALWQLRNEATAHINALWQDIKPLLLARAQQRASPPAQAQGAQRHAAAAAALEVVAENADACLGVVSTGGQGSGSSIKVLQSHTHTQTHTHTTHTHTKTHTHTHTHTHRCCSHLSQRESCCTVPFSTPTLASAST